jgi:hypothetical protein
VLEGRRGPCPECAQGFFEGNGRCRHCDGTGINAQIDSAQAKCPFCHGTGVCSACGGTGRTGSDDDPNKIQTLFN